MTSAPSSPRKSAVAGPKMITERSSTRMPASASGFRAAPVRSNSRSAHRKYSGVMRAGAGAPSLRGLEERRELHGEPHVALQLQLPRHEEHLPRRLPESMSSQSWPDICNVRLGLAAAPSETLHFPSLMTAFQVPPPSPPISYWIVALVPVALSGRNRLSIKLKVSLTVGISVLL